jgi:hypothetical protein
MMYIGNSLSTVKRFHNDFISGKSSHFNLQQDIRKYGLHYFTLYIFEIVQFPDSEMSYASHKNT